MPGPERPDSYQFVTVTRPDFEVEVREVPVSSAAAVLPMTLEQMGKEADASAKPIQVKSLPDAFDKFKPAAHLEFAVKGVNFVFDAEFKSLTDFDPEEMQKSKDPREGSPTRRNDLVKYRAKIAMLNRIKEVLAQPHVAQAWADPTRRAAIIGAVTKLRGKV